MGHAINAVLLRASAHWFAGLDVDFGNAFMTVFLQFLVGTVQATLFRLMFFGDFPRRGEFDWSGVWGIPLAFCLQALVIGVRLQLSYLRACLVFLGVYFIFLCVIVIIVLVVLLFIWMLV